MVATTETRPPRCQDGFPAQSVRPKAGEQMESQEQVVQEQVEERPPVSEREHATLHALDVANHVVQRWMVGENKVLVNGKSKLVSNVRHDFGLLHCVNTQLTLKVLVEFNEVGGYRCGRPRPQQRRSSRRRQRVLRQMLMGSPQMQRVLVRCLGIRASTVGVAGVAGAGAGAHCGHALDVANHVIEPG